MLTLMREMIVRIPYLRAQDPVIIESIVMRLRPRMYMKVREGRP